MAPAAQARQLHPLGVMAPAAPASRGCRGNPRRAAGREDRRQPLSQTCPSVVLSVIAVLDEDSVLSVNARPSVVLACWRCLDGNEKTAPQSGQPNYFRQSSYISVQPSTNKSQQPFFSRVHVRAHSRVCKPARGASPRATASTVDLREVVPARDRRPRGRDVGPPGALSLT